MHEQLAQAVHAGNDARWVLDAIDSMTHAQRIEFRAQFGNQPTPRNLWYDYEKQVWITLPNGKLS